MEVWFRFKMDLATIVILLCLQLAIQFESVNCYSASTGVISRTVPKTGRNIIKSWPNHESGDVSVHSQITYRVVDPSGNDGNDGINGYNRSVSSFKLVASVFQNTSARFPVFVSFIQRHEKITLQLPSVYRNADGQTSALYNEVSRTLCIPNIPLDNSESQILVTFSTGSFQPIPFKIKFKVEDNLQVLLNKQANFTITPTTPTFVHFPWMNGTDQNVVIRMSSDNDHCMGIAIQKPTCPTFDNEDIFGQLSQWKFMAQKGTIRVNMRDYLQGFYIKILLLQDDSLCGRTSDFKRSREKKVYILVENDLVISTWNGHFWIAIAGPPLISLFVGIIFGMIYIVSYTVTRNRMVSCRTQETNKAENRCVSVQKFSNENSPSTNYGRWTVLLSIFFAIPVVQLSISNALNPQGINGVCSYNDLCSHPLWIFKNFNHLWANVCYPVLGSLFILFSAIKKSVKAKIDENEGIQFQVGLYYSMGLALMVKGIISTSYHLCPSEFNFQYDLTYLSVIIAICLLKVLQMRRPKSLNVDTSCGILAVWFLVSSMGVIFERHASEWEEAFWVFRIVIAVVQGLVIFYAAIFAIYIGYPINRCPKVITREEVPLQRMVLTELRKHQATSPDDDEEDTNVMKSIGDIPRFLWILPKLWSWKLPTCQLERWVYVFFMLCLNGLLIWLYLEVNYSLYGLIFLLANFGLNFLYYLIMKMIFGEFGFRWKSVQVFLYLLCAIVLGIFSALYFLKNPEDWKLSATNAQGGYGDCIWFQPHPFYDKHDVYHMLSAHALFFVFMTLLSIDDGVEGIDRDFLMAF